MRYSAAGLLRCVRYSHPPNSFHYCGPERQRDVLAYATGTQADQGLSEILSGFETLYKYLTFIAGENRIRDAFDPRVVSAYWLGNGLLLRARYRAMERHLTETLNLKKTLAPRQFSGLISKLDLGVPHHSFHVLNVFRRTGHAAIPHTLETMDSCRISWGMVVSGARQNGSGLHIVVKTRPLVYADGRLALGAPVIKTAISVNGIGKPGDMVTLHWGYVCDAITAGELANLRYFTDLSIAAANRTV